MDDLQANAGAAFSEVQLADGPIGFTIADQHGQGGPVVFISSDPQQGKRTLVIQNNTADPVLLETSSLLRLYLWPLLTDPEIGAIKVATSGWAATQVTGEDHRPHIEISPTQPLTLAPNTPVAIELDGMLASGTQPSGRVRVAYSGFGHLPPGAQRFTVMLLLPPTQGKGWPLTVGLGSRRDYGGSNDQGRAIYMTPWAVTPAKPAILNTFVLQISATDLLSFNGAHPRITVSFLSGATDWSLCSDGQIKAANVDIAQNPGQPWTAGKDTTGDLALFNVTPQPGTTTFSMDGPLGIRFSNLATTLPSGRSSRVLIQFTGLHSAGYDDGFAVVDLDKTDPVPHVRSFAAYDGDTPILQDPADPTGLGTGRFGPTTLEWDVFAAENCLLAEMGHVVPPTGDFAVTARQPLMRFTLQPQVSGVSSGSSATVEFRVGPPVVHVTPNPDAVAPHTPSVLSINCSNGDHCRLLSSDGSVLLDKLPLVCTPTVMAGAEDTTFTVVGVGVGETRVNTIVRVPPVECLITVNIVSYYIEVRWSTRYANSCKVITSELGNVIATDLQGTMRTWGYSKYRVEATGRGTASATDDAMWHMSHR